MSARADDLPSRYRHALADYMEQDRETALLSALDLGREALAEGRSLLDLVAAHNRLLPSFIAKAPADADVKKRFARAEEFLAQVVAPYDMANRGWVEVVSRLRAMNQTLEQQVVERTSALRASEQRFRDITESAGDWIWETGDGHRFTFFVGQSLETMAIPPDTVLGKTWWELAAADLEHDETWRRYRKAMDEHQPFRRFHQIIATSTGTRLYISISGKPIFDESGTFRGYRGTATDETVIVNAHHRTEQAETLLRDAIESLYEGIVIFDKEERLVSCNRAFRDMHAPCAEFLHSGASVGALLQDALSKGLFPDAIGREPAWLAERLGRYRHPAGATEHRFHGGRWLFVAERRMSNGGSAGLYIDITDLKRAQAALGASEERLDRAQRIAGIGSWELDIRSGEFIWSKEMYRLRDLAPGTQTPTLERFVDNVHDDDRGRLREWFNLLQAGETVPPIEYRRQRADDEMRIVVAEGQAIANAAGRIFKIAGTLQDVTERRSVERQLVHAQKMEAIGNLTGGMAHDFNNLLGVVIGNLDLLRERHGGNAEIDELAREALEAATRGADLTRGLLAFARRQPLHPRRVDVNQVVSDITKLLRRTLGERVDVVLDLARDVWPVVVDPAQLEAALANLATNARDAMPKGGRLSIATGNRHLDDDYAAHHPELASDDYAMIEVSDNGTGIAPEVLERIFEPFFTTKERGEGSGLGLAMVFGYVKQSGGHINVYSEVGVGTTFRLYLPRARGPVERAELRPAEQSPMGQGETVLVVEDNAALRRIAVRQLTQLGYAVREAENAREAVSLLEAEPGIDLLFTDVVMPGDMDGIELARFAVERRPPMKIVLTSGFSGTKINGDTGLPPSTRLLSKPYRKEELARVLRDALNAQRRA